MAAIHSFSEWLNESAKPIPSMNLESGLEIIKGLVNRGFKPKTAAAIAGNMWIESKFNPAIIGQGKDPYVGLIQWGSVGKRKQKLMAKPNWKKTETQLDFIKQEFDTVGAYKQALPSIDSAQTPEKAAEIVSRRYEGTTHGIPLRMQAASQLFDEWSKNNAPEETPKAYFQPGGDEDDSAWGEPVTQ